MSRPNAQSMKPATAAKKLDVYLPATPAEFQENPITRTELAALQEDPPQWLKDLRKNGPHPKNLVAAKLGVSIAGLARNGVTDALTTEQINQLLEEKPEWLVTERENFQEVLREERRLKTLHAAPKSSGAAGSGAAGRGTSGRGAAGRGATGRGATGRGATGRGATGRGAAGRGATGR